MGDITSPSNRIVLAMTGLAAIALAAISMGLIDAAFADLVGNLFGTIAQAFDASKEVTRVAVAAGQVVGAVVENLFF